MKKIKVLVILALTVATLQGCSRSVSDDLKETGNDAKREINKAARNVNDVVKDAVD